MIRRIAIETAARKYIGTPFAHQGRRAQQALDCVGLVLCIGEDLGLSDKFGVPFLRKDYPDYAALPTDTFVYDELRRRATERTPLDPMKNGDILAVRMPHFPCHAAIAVDRVGLMYMIHAYNSPPRQCVEHVISHAWKNRIVGVFEFPGVVD